MKPLNRIAVFVCLFLLGYVHSYALQQQPSRARPRPGQPQTESVLLNGSYLVQARNYQVFEFSFDPAYGAGQIGGRISVQGPTNFDIQAWILDYPNLENFINRQAFNTFLNIGRVRLKNFSVTLNPGRYYLVFDNTFSALNSKSVFAQVAVRQFPATPTSKSTPPEDQTENRTDDRTDDQSPYAEEDGFAVANYRGRQLISLKKLFDKALSDECCYSKFSGSGVITEVEYKQEDILSFTLKLPSSQRRNVYISSARFSNADRGWLYTLIKENNKVRVKGCLCGNGGYWHALEISLVQ
jgi:hypothetical protein